MLVLMAHQNYFRFRSGEWSYEVPDERPAPTTSPSAARSLAMIGSYFAPEKPITLLVGIFHTDGGWQPDGSWIPSDFREATGAAYLGTMASFDQRIGNLIVRHCKKFDVPL